MKEGKVGKSSNKGCGSAEENIFEECLGSGEWCSTRAKRYYWNQAGKQEEQRRRIGGKYLNEGADGEADVSEVAVRDVFVFAVAGVDAADADAGSDNPDVWRLLGLFF